MTEPTLPDFGSLRRAASDAMASLDSERAKFNELSRIWREESTTVTTKDKALSMTFDGRGELVDLTFNGTKYRSMPPAQLASLIMETLQRGRSESIEKLTSTVPDSDIPGIDIAGFMDGTVDPKELVDKLMEPMLGSLDGIIPGERRDRPEGENSKERKNG